MKEPTGVFRHECPICSSSDITRNWWRIPYSTVAPEVCVNGAMTNLIPTLDGSAQIYSYSLCRKCGSTFLDPHSCEDSSYRASNYHVARSKDPSALAGYKAQYDRHIKELVRPGLRVLDAGCGSGSYMLLAMADGADGFGVELEEPSVKYLNGLRLRPHDIAVARGLDCAEGLKDLGEFDVIVMSEVFEHIEQPLTAMKNLRGVLADRGKIWFTAQATEGKLPIRPGEPIYSSEAGLREMLSGLNLLSIRMALEAGRWKILAAPMSS